MVPTSTSVVTNCSTTGEKTPIKTMIPSTVNSKKPIEANAIFISLVFKKEINDIILIKVDKPRNENRRKSSISFMDQAFSLM